MSVEVDPFHEYTSAGEYEVILVAFNEIGCPDSIKMKLTIGDDYALYAPNVFTPDGDGINDKFLVRGFNILEFKLMIFNRWGELIHTSYDMREGWDGKYEGIDSQIDVYVYKLLFRDVFNRPHVKYGTVTLVR